MMKGGLVILKAVRKILQKILTTSIQYDFGENISAEAPPEDVKEGHFAVYTVNNGECRRFVIELSYLAHPGFLKLLEQAEEEFGFEQTGVLAIPCPYTDLQSIVGSKCVMV
ncbi:SAUR-like auxin-responsive protein family [Striga asiatica]|uniref:SAUR-like auxin-responsive protein family n=1 Tax=Striga asiatica TaxID=4170 RepID=A0A5A7QNL5_STRAF|nr:SAUR-like auxin-responsive protein family [Striga asiatica]